MCVITQREGAYLCIESISTRFLQKRKKGEEVVGRNGEMESGPSFRTLVSIGGGVEASWWAAAPRDSIIERRSNNGCTNRRVPCS